MTIRSRTDTSADSAALFLDLDGTLAPIASRPDAVGPNPARTVLLQRALKRLSGRVAVISGRTIGDIDRIIGGACPCVSGVHGLHRRRADGRTILTAPHPRMAEATEALKAFAQAHPGLVVEDKDVSAALHYRAAPEARHAVLSLATRLAAATGLTLQEGHMVAELRTPGADKGHAVRAYLAESPFAGATPIFVGDDLTDESGFAAVREAGGLGLLVGDIRPSAAHGRLAGPAQVLAWLASGLDSGAFRWGEAL